MVINISVRSITVGFSPTDIILLTQGYYPRGTRLNTMYSGFVFTAYSTLVR